MNIVLLGATGFVGSALLNEALDRGHSVTAIARHPDKLGRERLVEKIGNVDDATTLASLIAGHDTHQRVQSRVEERGSVRRTGTRHDR